jgi:hypothetical protein
MTSTSAVSTRRPARQLSGPLVGLASIGFLAGVASGGVTYVNRSSTHSGYSSANSAWWPHIVLFLLVTAVVLGARWRGRQRVDQRRGGRLPLLAPVGKRAQRRVLRTLREARDRPAVAGRLAIATAPATLMLYLCWRVGLQVLGGLDPNFIVDAWGGPSYLGAMACHYLDCGVTIAVSGWLLSRLLLPDPIEG